MTSQIIFRYLLYLYGHPSSQVGNFYTAKSYECAGIIMKENSNNTSFFFVYMLYAKSALQVLIQIQKHIRFAPVGNKTCIAYLATPKKN